MKVKLLFLLIFFLFSVSVFAANSGIGVKGFYTFSGGTGSEWNDSVSDLNADSEAPGAFGYGVLAYLKFTDILVLQSEVNFRKEFTRVTAGSDYIENEVSVIDIPVLLKAAFKNNRSITSFYAGPDFKFLGKITQSLDIAGLGSGEGELDNQKDFGMGLVLGVNSQYLLNDNFGFLMDVRGIIPFSSDINFENASGGTTEYKVFDFDIGIGFVFNL